MANYLYIRVSDKSQNEARQLNDLKTLDVPEQNVYIDKQSGKNFDRPEYQRMISNLKEGDLVYFHSIDRMGRNYDEIIENWRYITKEIKADIIVLDMPLLNTTMKENDLTGRLISDIVLQLLSYVAQKERESILTRQKEGIAIAKAEGKYCQMTFTKEAFFEVYEEIRAGRMNITQAAKALGTTRNTIYAKLKEYGLR